jgi:hypothetical protein
MIIIFREMLVPAALHANIKFPEDCENYYPGDFPHFHVFCNIQLGREFSVGAPFNNAEIISKISDDEIRNVTLEDLFKLGVE